MLHAPGPRQNATADEIREAWRSVAFHYYPDDTGGDFAGISRTRPAYDFPREEGLPRKGPSGPSMPHRPQLKKCVIERATDEIKACSSLLDPEPTMSNLSSDGTDQIAKPAGASPDHVPDPIGCFGCD